MGMKPEVTRQLLELNASFYQTFASEFSSTRQRLQPGVTRLVNQFFLAREDTGKTPSGSTQETRPSGSILDLGCGNGGLFLHLAGLGFTGSYIGLDFSPDLLAIAQRRQAGLSQSNAKARFQFANLANINLEPIVQGEFFDFILAFATLHHLPGVETRLGLLRQVRGCLAPGGRFIHSEWQFQRSPRWIKRILPWERVGLAAEDLEPGDYLLDWQATGENEAPGLRYVHHFSEDELAELAQAAGFRPVESFYSDGREGDLSLYQVWEVFLKISSNVDRRYFCTVPIV